MADTPPPNPPRQGLGGLIGRLIGAAEIAEPDAAAELLLEQAKAFVDARRAGHV